MADLEARLRQALTLPFQMDARNPRADERPLVPTVAVKNRLLAPFAMLVKQYGIPQYGEVDPTPLFALTFLLMFGAMFGDLGQGAVIAVAAWYYRDKLGRFCPLRHPRGRARAWSSGCSTAASSASRTSCRPCGCRPCMTRS